MHFAQPIWILIGLLSCLGIYLLQRIFAQKRQRGLESFAARGLLGRLTDNVSTTKRTLKLFLLLAGIFCCFLALARPQYGHHWQEVKRKGIDILFGIDTSLSMSTEDVQPNRLSRAKLAILDFVDQLSGDRVGLLPFAGSAFLLCPLTVDYLAFEESLQAVDTSIIPQQGTSLAEAIRTAEAVLHNDANHKILILITDGESLQGDAISAAEEAAAQDMTVFTVGVGTPAGELIPVQQNGRREFIKDEGGNFVVSKLDEEALRAIARATAGIYAPLGNQGQGLISIYERKLRQLPEKELAERRQKIPIDRFPWFLGLALIFFGGEYLLTSRKSAGTPLLPRKFRWKKSAGLLLLLPLLELLQPSPTVLASPGEKYFNASEYEEAARYYQDALEDNPESAALHYNLGAAAYKRDRFDEAIASFNQALQSDDLSLQERAYYNLGNSHYRQGETMEGTDPQKTIGHWQEALTAYSSSLKLQPENQKARFNHDFVEKKLDQLQQQQKKQKQQQPNSNQGNEDKQQEGRPSSTQQENSSQNGDQQDSADARSQANRQEQKEDEEQSELPQGQPQTAEENRQQRSDQQYSQRQKMSREEAEQLLREMQNEEGRLNFLPRAENDNNTNKSRNW